MNTERWIHALSCAVIVASVALLAKMAVANPDSPGWNYGGQNCGCLASNSNTPATCKMCCDRAARVTFLLDPEELDNCLAFCDQMGEPCQPTCPWYNPFCWF